MYSVNYVQGDQWRVVDSREQLIFVGTKQQVEDWLDHLENAHRQPSLRLANQAGGQRILHWLRRLASELMHKPRDARAD